MPRLSVDIDLVYLPLEDRKKSLSSIVEALRRIKRGIENTVRGTRVDETPGGEFEIARLIVHAQHAHIKIEPNMILRGSHCAHLMHRHRPAMGYRTAGCTRTEVAAGDYVVEYEPGAFNDDRLEMGKGSRSV